MKTRTISRVVFFLILLSHISFIGCSIVGFGIGAIVDSKQPSQIIIKNQNISSIEQGKKIEVFLRNGDQIHGKFKELKYLTDAEYSSIYEKNYDEISHKLYLPSLGDTIFITIDRQNSNKINDIFKGFNLNTFLLTTLDNKNGHINFNNVWQISNDKCDQIDINSIDDFNAKGLLPYKSIILPNNNNLNERKIHTNKISKVSIAVEKRGKLAGFIFGAAIDVNFVLYIKDSIFKKGSFFKGNVKL